MESKTLYTFLKGLRLMMEKIQTQTHLKWRWPRSVHRSSTLKKPVKIHINSEISVPELAVPAKPGVAVGRAPLGCGCGEGASKG